MEGRRCPEVDQRQVGPILHRLVRGHGSGRYSQAGLRTTASR
jgi:hypothetical protein